jgi:hydroxyacylglutathione hydrolase
MPLKVHIIPILSDNYSYLIVDQKNHVCAIVDPAEPDKCIQEYNSINRHEYNGALQLKYLFTTHHHWDHAGGNVQMKKQFPDLEVIGSRYEEIPARTRQVSHDEQFQWSESSRVRVLYTPCHTRGHVQYLVSSDDDTSQYHLFSGDTFFVAGCGRFFEGDAQQMTENVKLMKTLDIEKTYMYPGHEYTVTNLKFALTVEPENQDLQKKMEHCQKLRNEGRPTVPSRLADEFKYNPFFRVFQESVQKWANAVGDPVKTMKIVREAKDHFKAT